MQNLERFGELLHQAAVLGEEIARETEALVGEEARVLEELVEKVKPALKFASRRIMTYAYHSGHQFHSWQRDYYHERGIVLVDNFGREYTDKDYRGNYVGDQLILTQSGKLVRLVRSGDWSNWQGESCQWNAKPTDLTAEQAVRRYGLKAIVSGLCDELGEAVKKAEEEKKALQERLAALEAAKAALGS